MKKSRVLRWGSFILAVFTVFLTAAPITAYAETPYPGYNYDYWEIADSTPAAYVPVDSYSGEDLGAGKFLKPEDMYVLENGDIYICDTGNNRIVIADKNLKLKEVIETFKNNGKQDTFNAPQGLFAADEDNLYVADTGNNRVLLLGKDRTAKTVFENPVSENLPKDFVFIPQKVAVDYSGRVYVVAQNAFEGLMCFSPDGQYSGYFGTNKVTVSPIDWFWRQFATKEQRSKMQLYIPAEFSNLDIDEDGFVYTTDVDLESARSIKKFNPKSIDILKNYKVNADASKTDLIGDLDYPMKGLHEGRSTLVDVKYRGDGIYSVLDNKRGRVISYDYEGNILYIFGTLGNQMGTFKQPAALESYGSNLYVLDRMRGEFVVFKTTTYGELINKGTQLRYDGDEASAVECWEAVLKMDPNFQLANVGIGKSLLAANKNEEAMYYLKAGMDKENYSVAFKRHRNDVMKRLFPYVAIVGIVILISVLIKNIYRRVREEREKA